MDCDRKRNLLFNICFSPSSTIICQHSFRGHISRINTESPASLHMALRQRSVQGGVSREIWKLLKVFLKVFFSGCVPFTLFHFPPPAFLPSWWLECGCDDWSQSSYFGPWSVLGNGGHISLNKKTEGRITGTCGLHGVVSPYSPVLPTVDLEARKR